MNAPANDADMRLSEMDEAQLRAAEVPSLHTRDELLAYIDQLTDREHDYGTCVYAMSMAATAAFNYVAHKLSVTGFQASCADMDVLRRTRNYKGPFMVVDGGDALYPQYDLHETLTEFLAEIRPWLAEQARAKLDGKVGAHPDVTAHWQQLAAGESPAVQS